MAQRQRIYLEKQQRDAIDDVLDDGEADNESEAARTLINAGMAKLGYGTTNHHTDTPLKQLAAEFGRAFAWIGIGWLAFTFSAPVEWRLGAVFAFAAAFGCTGLYVVLEKHEPKVSNSLKRLIGRGEQA